MRRDDALDIAVGLKPAQRGGDGAGGVFAQQQFHSHYDWYQLWACHCRWWRAHVEALRVNYEKLNGEPSRAVLTCVLWYHGVDPEHEAEVSHG